LRERFLRGLVWFGVVLWASTEALSAFHALNRVSLALVWGLALAAAALRVRGWPLHPRWAREPLVWFCVAACGCVLALTALAAGFSPPNSADAMAYHMPRVIYWAEQSSVRFFPTVYFNQIMLQPFAEYAMLHTFLLTGGDRLINFVQWFASAASMVAVSSVAGQLGWTWRGQAIAALFCATVPSGILASSGAKNDYFLAMWLVTAVFFGLRCYRAGTLRDATLMGAALGFALLTKGTAYVFAPWPLLLFLPRRRLVVAGAIAFAINAPHYVRNYSLSGSPMGFDSAQGDGVYRWRNERFGWRETASNAIRNVSDQLGARSTGWNEGVYRIALGLHRAIGIDPNDPATTWRYASFGPPVNANHEANAPNRWQLAILLAIACVLISRVARKHNWERALYATGLLLGFIAFCGYLKWQPYFSRMLLPLFVMASPLVGIVEEIRTRWAIQAAFCLLLLNDARPALLENWVRPLKGPRSVFRVPRDAQYFSDLTQWNDEAAFREAVSIAGGSKCETVGIDIAHLQIEYPIMALLREINPGIRFVHTGVANASSRYAPPALGSPCSVVCLGCAGDRRRLDMYGQFPKSQAAGSFVVFTR
jgi:hypothetical protein